MPRKDIRQAIAKIRELTDQPFTVNLLVPEAHSSTSDHINKMCNYIKQSCAELNLAIHPAVPPYAPSFDDQMRVVLDEKVSIVSFTFGIPSDEWL